MARKKQKRVSRNRGGIIGISIVVVLLSVMLTYKGSELKEKNQEYILKEQSLTKQIEAEQERSSELTEYSKYVQTKKYVEEVAREKLGLVYKDEILFKPSNQ